VRHEIFKSHEQPAEIRNCAGAATAAGVKNRSPDKKSHLCNTKEFPIRLIGTAEREKAAPMTKIMNE
jgi:hypothetical protein